jgi:hypothetical protein
MFFSISIVCQKKYPNKPIPIIANNIGIKIGMDCMAIDILVKVYISVTTAITNADIPLHKILDLIVSDNYESALSNTHKKLISFLYTLSLRTLNRLSSIPILRISPSFQPKSLIISIEI